MENCLHSIIIHRCTQEERPREQKRRWHPERHWIHACEVMTTEIGGWLRGTTTGWGRSEPRTGRSTGGTCRTSKRWLDMQCRATGEVTWSDSLWWQWYDDSNKSVGTGRITGTCAWRGELQAAEAACGPCRQGRVKGSSVGRPGPLGPSSEPAPCSQGIITLSAWLRATVRRGKWAQTCPRGQPHAHSIPTSHRLCFSVPLRLCLWMRSWTSFTSVQS